MPLKLFWNTQGLCLTHLILGYKVRKKCMGPSHNFPPMVEECSSNILWAAAGKESKGGSWHTCTALFTPWFLQLASYISMAQPRFWNIVPCLYASEGVHPQFPPTCSLTSSFQQLCQPTAWLLPSSSHSTILKSFFPAVVEASLHRPLCMTQHRIKQLQEGEKKRKKKWSKHNTIPRKTAVLIFSVTENGFNANYNFQLCYFRFWGKGRLCGFQTVMLVHAFNSVRCLVSLKNKTKSEVRFKSFLDHRNNWSGELN